MASIFLAAFLGCLLALGMVAIAVMQYLAWKARKHFGDMSAMLEGVADGDPALRAQLDSMARRRTTRSGSIPPPSPGGATVSWDVQCDRAGCKRTQSIPPDLAIGTASDAWLNGIGWSVQIAGDVRTILCPMCAKDAAQHEDLTA